MSNLARFPTLTDTGSQGHDPRSEVILNSIKSLISALSYDERQRLLADLIEMLKPISAPKAGDVLGAVVKLLPRQKTWTVAGIREEVERQGVEATQKEVYNAVGYLSKRGHIRRISYGRYVVDGVAIETGDDLGGVPSLTEQEPDS